MIDGSSIPPFIPFGADSWRDPHPVYRRLRSHDAIHYTEVLDAFVLSRFEHVFVAARDTETFSSARGLTFASDEAETLGLLPTLVMMDPPRHTAYRRAVAAGFTPRRVETIEAMVREFAVERIEALRAAGGGDFVAAVAKPLPSLVVAHYLGVPIEDRHRFDAWTDAIVAANARGRVVEDAAAAVEDLYGYFTHLAERRRRHPGHDMISALLTSGIGGEPATVADVLGYAFVMIAGGNDTTTGLLSGAADLLTRAPEERHRLIDDPSLVMTAVDECLRLTSPVQGLCRRTTRTTRLGDREIPEGAAVLLLYASANRDEAEFGPDAERFDVGRTIPRLLSFSMGAHYCLGASAARLQARVVLEELLRRCPEFVADGDAGTFADGAFVRRFATLPFAPE